MGRGIYVFGRLGDQTVYLLRFIYVLREEAKDCMMEWRFERVELLATLFGLEKFIGVVVSEKRIKVLCVRGDVDA